MRSASRSKSGRQEGTRTRIRSAVASKMICVEEAEIRLTVSLGLAAVEVGDDCVSLVKRADEALYAAKRAGRNCGFFHNNRECKRIEAQGSVSSAKPAAALTEAPGTPRCGPDEAELAAACCDLRQRLAELAEVDPSTPEDPHDRR